jgi:hypothetical protein
MADRRLSLLLLVVLAPAASGCDRQPSPPQVTVKLPPARPATPHPAFRQVKPAEAARF